MRKEGAEVDGLVNVESLRAFVAGVFAKLGVSEEGSRTAAEVLLFADMRGISSHGVSNLARLYVKRIRGGAIDPAASARVVREDAATALLDGQFGLGLVVATGAMDLAIEKARACGAGVVAVRRSTHFGSASFYSMRALDADMIGIATSNLGSQVIARPPDGRVKMLGTNPLSVAAPAAELPPFSLDMSTTVVSTGRLRVSGRDGGRVPAGWLVDDEGSDVTDPSRFFNGSAHLQMLGGSGSAGGYKGYGLGLAVDVLSGLLAGADVGPDVRLLQPGGGGDDGERENIGHLFIAIDIGRFRPAGEFRAEMDRMLGALLACPSREGCDPVVYPGHPEAHAGAGRPSDTVAVAEHYVEGLLHLASELGLKFPEVVWTNGCGASGGLREEVA
jgi:LDH2 family malate/lactate/ureidoglycolate dehydrogenase